MMKTDPKVLFQSLIKCIRCDLVMDIGSCNGRQGFGFRLILPEADVVAFEANPYNYREMARNPGLIDNRIIIENMAVADKDGESVFYIRKADYHRPDTLQNNRGISSLMECPEDVLMKMVKVPCCRLDTYVQQHYPQASRIALWIDVEGAEGLVAQGMERIADRVRLMQIECALRPRRMGQMPCAELERLLGTWGFSLLGTRLDETNSWGDVVFIHNEELSRNRRAIDMAIIKARLARVLKVHHIAHHLGRRVPSAYERLRQWYGRHA
jgi:FkbM family methyltransferase